MVILFHRMNGIHNQAKHKLSWALIWFLWDNEQIIRHRYAFEHNIFYKDVDLSCLWLLCHDLVKYLKVTIKSSDMRKYEKKSMKKTNDKAGNVSLYHHIIPFYIIVILKRNCICQVVLWYLQKFVQKGLSTDIYLVNEGLRVQSL